MENAKAPSDESKPVGAPVPVQQQSENPTDRTVSGDENRNDAVAAALPDAPVNDRNGRPPSSRTPFTNLSQVDADLALARTLQEQERAYMMLMMNGNGGDYGIWEAEGYGFVDDENFDHDYSDDEYDGSDLDEDEDEDDVDDDDDEDEDAFDVHEHGEGNENHGVVLDPSAFSSDEAYARALLDAENREMAARLLALAGINEMMQGNNEDPEDNSGNSQDAWEDVDPDELSYEELLALGEVVGTESRGLSADVISSLPSIKFKPQSSHDGNNDACVICRLEYEDGDTLTLLACKHSYHPDCIDNWLRINKVCPVCNAEVSTSGNS